MRLKCHVVAPSGNAPESSPWKRLVLTSTPRSHEIGAERIRTSGGREPDTDLANPPLKPLRNCSKWTRNQEFHPGLHTDSYSQSVIKWCFLLNYSVKTKASAGIAPAFRRFCRPPPGLVLGTTPWKETAGCMSFRCSAVWATSALPQVGVEPTTSWFILGIIGTSCAVLSGGAGESRTPVRNSPVGRFLLQFSRVV